MEDKLRYKWQLPVSYLLVFFIVVLYGFLIFFSGVEPIFYLYAIIGVLLSPILSAFFHEFGHFLVAKRRGCEVYYFSFGPFIYDKNAKITHKKRKIKISLLNENLGETRYFPQKDGDYLALNRSVLKGGLLGGLIIAIVLNCLLILSLFGVFGQVVSSKMVVIFGFAPYSFYAFLINAIAWFHPLNDASQLKILKENPSEGKALNSYFEVLKSINQDKTYCQIDEKFFIVEDDVSEQLKEVLLLFALKRALQLNEKEKADEICKRIEEEQFFSLPTLCELSFKYALDGNFGKSEMFFEKCNEFSFEEDEILELKANLVHAKNIGDDKYVEVARPTLIKLCKKSKFCKGDLIYVAKTIEDL